MPSKILILIKIKPGQFLEGHTVLSEMCTTCLINSIFTVGCRGFDFIPIWDSPARMKTMSARVGSCGHQAVPQ